LFRKKKKKKIFFVMEEVKTTPLWAPMRRLPQQELPDIVRLASAAARKGRLALKEADEIEQEKKFNTKRVLAFDDLDEECFPPTQPIPDDDDPFDVSSNREDKKQKVEDLWQRLDDLHNQALDQTNALGMTLLTAQSIFRQLREFEKNN
jgi:hypothetical protein